MVATFSLFLKFIIFSLDRHPRANFSCDTKQLFQNILTIMNHCQTIVHQFDHGQTKEWNIKVQLIT